MICPYCKETILDGAVKCRHCGSIFNTIPTHVSSYDSLAMDEIWSYVGPKAEYYIRKFSVFTNSVKEEFRPTWNWSCFGFTFIWMLYRKMYIQSLITFFIFLIPGVNVLLHIAAGMLGNYLYYRHVKVQIIQTRMTESHQNVCAKLKLIGGVNKWVIITVLLVLFAMGLALFFFFAAISTFIGESVDKITI